MRDEPEDESLVLASGREFTDADRKDTARFAIVNEAMAQQF
jgi:hypothetical protein